MVPAAMRGVTAAVVAVLACAGVHAAATAVSMQAPASAPAPSVPAAGAYLRYDDIRPILETLRDEFLPGELKAGAQGVAREAAWSAWAAGQDKAVRTRVVQGDEDSLFNLLLYGVSFTSRPRVTERELDRLRDPEAGAALVRQRIADLVAALASPGNNERLQFARQVLERRELAVRTEEDRAELRDFFAAGLTRLSEYEALFAALDAARARGEREAERVARATIFQDRGIAPDTSLVSSYAIDEALQALTRAGRLKPGGVRRIAIIGPGLDFADKREGYDFYPQQTIQPFAVVDSLTRLGLGPAGSLEVTTFDVSPRINEHLAGARQRSAQGEPYLVHVTLPSGPAGVAPALAGYWKRFGDAIGGPGFAAKPPPTVSVRVRAVRVPPAVVQRVNPRDANAVLQPLVVAADGEPPFDVIVATNVLVYYGVFDQSLLLLNTSKALRPGGVFLSNTEAFLLPSIPLVQVGYTDAMATTAPASGDRIYWYERQSP
jgi:hypothetical protein